MLRRITACLNAIALVMVSLIPLTVVSAKDRGTAKRTGTVSKIAPELHQSGGGQEMVRVVVQTNGRPSAVQQNAIATSRGHISESYETLNTLVADVPRDSLASLAARGDVAYISSDRPVKAQVNLARETVGATEVAAGLARAPQLTGKGVTIAIMDSGISTTHPDFGKNSSKSRIIAAVNFTGDDRTGDDNGHGTGVAGVAAGNGAASTGYAANYAGIAPEAHLLDLKVLDENGAGTTSSTLAAINWAIVNQKRFNIRVINLSLGTPVRESFRTDPLCLAVEQAVRAGIIVVSSAGNNGSTEEVVGHDANGDPIYRLVYGGINSPGNSPYVITVGATDSRGTVRRSDDIMARFSSKGPTRVDGLAKPDLVAPGRRLIAPMSQQNPATSVQYPDRVIQPVSSDATPNAYFKYSGTSFSAPVVSGAIALMLEANKSLTPALTKATLLRTAQALPESQFESKAQNISSQGAGALNVAAAVEMAESIVPNANKLKAGARIFRAGVTLSSLKQSTIIGGETVAQTARVLYSNGVLFTQRPILTDGILMSDGILISDGILMSDGAVLGSGILMSDGAVLASGIVMSDGAVLASGILMSDGVILSDGILMSDGAVMG
ncbi:MAG: S8 family peptidase, partial [Acidobacteriota bacterium]|nr:S8 family peptidase [Acidobacteriota bacterium]